MLSIITLYTLDLGTTASHVYLYEYYSGILLFVLDIKKLTQMACAGRYH